MDWVGTTERHKETTDLIQHLLGLPADFQFNITNKAHDVGGNCTVTMEMLGSDLIEYHRNISTLDYELHQQVQEWQLRIGASS